MMIDATLFSKPVSKPISKPVAKPLVFKRSHTEAIVEYSKRNSMALNVFRPQEHQEPIFRNYSRELLIRGGNRSGKSTCAAALFAAIATDTPITLEDGTQIDARMPWQKGRCLTMWIIGYDSKHIGQTIFRLLFKKGLFFTILDKKSSKLRAWKRYDREDKARESEKRESNPLIPGSFVDPGSWDWENKKGKEFKSVVIWNPETHEPIAQIFAFSSKADPKAGDPVDVIWVDESIENPAHYEEWQARLVDYRGRMFWSSWPKSDNEALISLTERAELEKHKANPIVREIVLSMSANMQLDEESKQEQLAGITSEETRHARDLGLYVNDLIRMYPLYDKEKHCVRILEDFDKIPEEDALSRLLSKTDGIPPREWTRELIVDPGTTHPGVLLCAIPPGKLSHFRVVYQEIYPGRADADELAAIVKKHTTGQRFYRMIIDEQAGQQKQMGYRVKVKDNYSRAFKKHQIKCIATGFRFTPGCKDVGGRIGRLREWLHLDKDADAFPILRIVNHRCPNLCKQLRQDKQSRVNNEVKEDRPAPNQRRDMAVCLEYWAASSPVHVPYAPQIEDGGSTFAYWMRRIGKKRKSTSSASIGPSYVSG